jgi:hypothetical protein
VAYDTVSSNKLLVDLIALIQILELRSNLIITYVGFPFH